MTIHVLRPKVSFAAATMRHTSHTATFVQAGLLAEIALEASLQAGLNVWQDSSLRNANWYAAESAGSISHRGPLSGQSCAGYVIR